MSKIQPCHLPLVALRADETCPRCGHPAREHRGHPSYQETPMTETTEPTREQIEEWLSTHFAPSSIDDERAVLRMALRALDAEAQIAAMRRHYDAAAPDHNLLALLDLYHERAEQAERERDEAFGRGRAAGRSDVGKYANAIGLIDSALGRCGARPLRETVAAVECVVRERDEARAKIAEMERELGAAITEAAAHDAAATQYEKDIERLRAQLAAMTKKYERIEAEQIRDANRWSLKFHECVSAKDFAAMTERADRLQRHFDEAAPEHNLPALLDLYAERERAATDRAEKAERERAAAIAAGEDIERQSAEVSDLLTELFVTDGGDERDDLELVRGIAREADALRAKLADAERCLAEVERERDEERHLATVRGEMLSVYEQRTARVLCTKLSNMHRRAQRAEGATADARREAIGQRMRADWWRREAKRLGWTPDYPELRDERTSDARIDCESSSLLLLSTWARRVMMRPKNRSKGVPDESILKLLRMAWHELSEARWAIADDAPTDDILAELGDAAAYIAFAMREIEKRRIK